jgi:hypothetical protein
MNAAEKLILFCVAAAFIIEICDHVRMHRLMDRHVARLNLSQDTGRCKRCRDQATADNREQAKVQHRSSPFSG